VPRIAFVNKMDRNGSDFHATIEQMHKRLAANAAAVQIPYYAQDVLQGAVDLIENKLIVYKDDEGLKFEVNDVPAELEAQAHKYRDRLFEKLAEVDEFVMDAFVHGHKMSVSEIKAAIRRNVIANRFVPVFCGASARNRNVQMLLDAVCDYLPSPLDLPPIKGTNPDTEEFEEIEASDDAPFCALCFKIATDPYVGKIYYIRVYSGTIKSGDYIYNVTKKTKERLTKLVRMHANRREIIESRVVNLNQLVSDLTHMLKRTIGEDVRLTTIHVA
jgi:elongation factor G